MITWMAITLTCVFVAALTAVVIARRRRLESPPAELPSAPGVSLTRNTTTPDTGSSLRESGYEGSCIDMGDATLARQPGIPFESLFRRPLQDEARRMDLRELVAVQQQGRISPRSEGPWRQTGRASVQRSVDGGDVLIFDRAVVGGSAEDAFTELVTRGNDVRTGLGTAAERVDLAWPQEAVLKYDGGVTGYFMPGLHPSYVLDIPPHGRAVRTLGAANGLTDVELQRLGDVDLLDLVRTVAIWLRAMHAAGVVFGDLGQRSLAYADAPVRIRVLDYDTARVVGRGALLASDPEAGHDPLASAGESSYDSDRFLFAQLAFRLLVMREDSGVIAPEDVPTRLLGLDDRRTSWLRLLWRRAAGPRGTRPTMDEWVYALEER